VASLLRTSCFSTFPPGVSVISVTHAEGLIRANPLYSYIGRATSLDLCWTFRDENGEKRDDMAGGNPMAKFAGRARPSRQNVTGDVSSVNSQKPETRSGSVSEFSCTASFSSRVISRAFFDFFLLLLRSVSGPGQIPETNENWRDRRKSKITEKAALARLHART